MRSFAAILTLILFSFPAYAQLVVPYYSLSCDSDFPSEQHVIDRVFTGNTPAFRVYFYTSNGTPANLSGTWAMTFAYGYTQQDTNGMVRIPGTWTNSNTCLFTSTNAFAGARDWYFSVYGNNTISGVKTFARGKMIEEYDPATGNSANLNLRTTFNWDEISNTGTPPWSLPGLWTTNLSGDVILPSGVLNLTNVTTMVAEPTTNTHAASKGYVDTADADLYPRNNPSNYVQSSITNGLATASWVTANFLTEAIAETLFDALGATATYSNWAEAYFYPRNNPSNYVTASVTNGLWAYVDGTNWVWITFYPRNNPSNWVTASITNGLYPASNPSNWVTASVTTGLYQASNPSNWVQASITNGLWVYQDGTNWVWLSFYPRNNPSNWVTAAITANVPTRAEASNSVTYETLAANGDIGVGAAQVAQGSHGHNSYLWSIGWSNSTSNYAAESSTVATVYFKTNWATENPDLIYPRNNPSNWITAITATSIVAGVGSTNVGMGLTNIYVQSNGVWILMPAVGGGAVTGGGDIYSFSNNVFWGTNYLSNSNWYGAGGSGKQYGMLYVNDSGDMVLSSPDSGLAECVLKLGGGYGGYGTSLTLGKYDAWFARDVIVSNDLWVLGSFPTNTVFDQGISGNPHLKMYPTGDGFAGGEVSVYSEDYDLVTDATYLAMRIPYHATAIDFFVPMNGTATNADMVDGLHASSFYLNSNPSNWVTASVTNGLASEGWVAAQGYVTDAITNGLWRLEDGTNWVANIWWPTIDASAITAEMIGQWDDAYGWGDHAGLYDPVGSALAVSNVLVGRTITINGLAGELSSNLSFTVAGGGGGDVYTTSNNTFAAGTTNTMPLLVGPMGSDLDLRSSTSSVAGRVQLTDGGALISGGGAGTESAVIGVLGGSTMSPGVITLNATNSVSVLTGATPATRFTWNPDGSMNAYGNSLTNVGMLTATTLVVKTSATLPATTMTGNLNLGANALVGNGGTTGLWIASSGYVGILTNTPSYHLDVNGSVQVKSNLTVTANYSGGYMAGTNAGGIFVPRYTASAYDFTQASGLTIDGEYHTLNISSIVPAGAKAITIRAYIKDNASTSVFLIRRDSSAGVTGTLVYSSVVNTYMFVFAPVAITSSRTVEYTATSGSDEVGLVITGWFM